MKAESTSVLMDGADSRRCEMGGSHKHQDGGRFKDKDGQRSWLGSTKNGKSSDKEHGSQPVNLSEITEVKGMPCHHVAGCDNLLAVLDASCEHVFLEKGSQKRTRCTYASSSSSSIEDSSDLPTRHSCSLKKYYTVTEDEDQCTGGLKEHFHSDYALDRVREEVAISDSYPHLPRMTRQREWCDSDRCLSHGSRLSKLSVCSPISEDNIYDGDDELREVPSSSDQCLNGGFPSTDGAFSCVSLRGNNKTRSFFLPEVETPVGGGHVSSRLSLKEERGATGSSPDMMQQQREGSGLSSMEPESPLSLAKTSKNPFLSTEVVHEEIGDDSSLPHYSSTSGLHIAAEDAFVAFKGKKNKAQDGPSIQDATVYPEMQKNVYRSENSSANGPEKDEDDSHFIGNPGECEANSHHTSVL